MKKTISICLIFMIALGSFSFGYGIENDSKSTLELNKSSYKQGDEVQISGIAYKDENVQPYASINIKIFSGSKEKFVKDLTADKNGAFSAVWSSASDQEIGTYIVQVDISGEKTLELEFSMAEMTNEDTSSPSGGSASNAEGSSEKETKKIKISGGKVELLSGEVILDIEKDTFDRDVNISVEVVDKDDVTLPKSTSSTKLMLVGKIYDLDAEGKEFKKSVTITLEYDKKKVKDTRKLGVYLYNEKTKSWEYVGGIVDTENKTISAELEHFSKYAVMENEKTFEDISIPWAEDQIEVLASRNIINGVDDNNYAPNQNISRAAFAKLLVNALNLKASKNVIKFNDIEEGKWYTQPVEIAASLGIVKGNGDSFNPNGEITREAMAVMIVRALKQVDAKGDYFATDLGFSDADSISEWAKNEVSIASNKGLVTGVSSTEFAPKENATRAQAAVMIYRLLKALDRI